MLYQLSYSRKPVLIFKLRIGISIVNQKHAENHLPESTRVRVIRVPSPPSKATAQKSSWQNIQGQTQETPDSPRAASQTL